MPKTKEQQEEEDAAAAEEKAKAEKAAADKAKAEEIARRNQEHIMGLVDFIVDCEGEAYGAEDIGVQRREPLMPKAGVLSKHATTWVDERIETDLDEFLAFVVSIKGEAAPLQHALLQTPADDAELLLSLLLVAYDLDRGKPGTLRELYAWSLRSIVGRTVATDEGVDRRLAALRTLAKKTHGRRKQEWKQSECRRWVGEAWEEIERDVGEDAFPLIATWVETEEKGSPRYFRFAHMSIQEFFFADELASKPPGSASPERKSGRRGSTGADEVVDLETFYSDDWFRSVVPMLTGIAQVDRVVDASRLLEKSVLGENEQHDINAFLGNSRWWHRLRGSSFVELNLYYTGVKGADIRRFATCLVEMPNLGSITLLLASNSVGDDGCAALSDALGDLKYLERVTLDLSGNGIKIPLVGSCRRLRTAKLDFSANTVNCLSDALHRVDLLATRTAVRKEVDRLSKLVFESPASEASYVLRPRRGGGRSQKQPALAVRSTPELGAASTASKLTAPSVRPAVQLGAASTASKLTAPSVRPAPGQLGVASTASKLTAAATSVRTAPSKLSSGPSVAMLTAPSVAAWSSSTLIEKEVLPSCRELAAQLAGVATRSSKAQRNLCVGVAPDYAGMERLEALTLDLSRNYLGPEGGRPLADGVAGLRNLRALTLQLGACHIGQDAAAALATSLRSLPLLEELELGLANNNLASLALHSASLRRLRLHLGANCFQPDEADRLCSGSRSLLEGVPGLQALSLDLVGNFITDVGCGQLAHQVMFLRSLEELSIDLSASCVSPAEACESFAHALAYLRTLRTCTLSFAGTPLARDSESKETAELLRADLATRGVEASIVLH